MGANVDARDITGKTPFMTALMGRQKKSIEMLMYLKANPFIKTKSGISILDHIGSQYKKLVVEYASVTLIILIVIQSKRKNE